MRKHYFVKEGSPVWIHVPGTPFTLPGERQQYARLPGMTEWAPNEVVERMGKGLKDNVPAEELAQEESERGLLTSAAKGGVGGGIAGSIAARIAGGEASTAPFKKLFKKGLTKKTLEGLSKVPRSGKILPLLGLGAGVAGGVGDWAVGRDQRHQEAQEVAKGLLSEQILQQHAIGKARESTGTPILSRLPAETASMPSPKAVVLGSTGV